MLNEVKSALGGKKLLFALICISFVSILAQAQVISTPSVNSPWPNPPQVFMMRVDDVDGNKAGMIALQGLMDEFQDIYNVKLVYFLACLAQGDDPIGAVDSQGNPRTLLGTTYDIWDEDPYWPQKIRRYMWSRGCEIGVHVRPYENDVDYFVNGATVDSADSVENEKKLITAIRNKLKEEFVGLTDNNIYGIYEHEHQSYGKDKYWQAVNELGFEWSHMWTDMVLPEKYWPARLQKAFPFTDTSDTSNVQLSWDNYNYSAIWNVMHSYIKRAEGVGYIYDSSLFGVLNGTGTTPNQSVYYDGTRHYLTPITGPDGTWTNAKDYIRDSMIASWDYHYTHGKAPFAVFFHPFQLDPASRLPSSSFYNPYFRDGLHDFIKYVFVDNKATYPDGKIWTGHQIVEYMRTGDIAHVDAMGNGQFTLDTTSPSAVSEINDGTGADIDTINTTTELSANWTASADLESGIAWYWYAIGTTPGGVDVLAWTNNGKNTSVTKSGLSLTPGQTYYFSVKAENTQRLVSVPANSNGQKVEISSPLTPPTTLQEVKVCSNVLDIKNGSAVSTMKFKKLPINSELKIYTLSGKLARTLNESNTEISFDGKNTNGDVIAQGVYIYLLKTPEGLKKTGKIAVKVSQP